MAEFFLVRLDPGLPPFRVGGLFHAIALHPGVLAVYAADLTGLPADRLAILCATAKPTQGELPLVELAGEPKGKKRRGNAA